jgi:amino acid transporter
VFCVKISIVVGFESELYLNFFVVFVRINKDAPFSMVFKNDPRWGWVSNVVDAGASLGILTSLLVAMLGQARYMCVIGHSHVILDWFAKVNSKTYLIYIGMLFVFYMVASALIYKRYVVSEKTTSSWPTLEFLLALSCIAIRFDFLWQFQRDPLGLAICGLTAITDSRSTSQTSGACPICPG